MGEIIKLRQRGGRDWHESRGRLYKAIMAGQEFEAGRMRAKRIQAGDILFFSATQLPNEWRKVIIQDQPDYVVYSYLTPIAWHVPNDGDDGGERWVVPNVKYSTTTTRHQNLVRTALIFNKTESIERVEDA